MQVLNQQSPQINFSCKYHTQFKPQYIRLGCSDDRSKDNILLCAQCVDTQLYDKSSFEQFQHIETLIHSQEKTVLHKLPPLNNQTLLNELNLLLEKDLGAKSLAERVIYYFDSLKAVINDQIDQIKKEMIMKCESIPNKNESLIELYNEISQKETIKKILIDGSSTFENAESKINSILKGMESRKSQNEQKVQDSLNSLKLLQNKFDDELPNQIKENILKLIKNINFFTKQEQQQSILQSEKTISEQLSIMIRNKSNFCSEEFEKEITTKIKEFSFVFNSIKCQSIFKDGYNSPIDFNRITEQQHLNNLEKCLKNTTKDQNLNKVNEQGQLILNLLKNPLNNLSDSFLVEIQKKLQIVSPLISDINMTNIYQENKQPFDFNQLTKEQLQNIERLIKLMKNPNEQLTQTYLNQLKTILNSNNYLYSPKLFELLSQYHILEMIQPEKRFILSQFGNSQTNLVFQKNDNIIAEIKKIISTCYKNTILSEFYLEQSKTYSITFKINKSNPNLYLLVVGVTNQGNQQELYKDGLCFSVQSTDGNNHFGVNTMIKGDKTNLRASNEFELKINLSNQQFEISDYPNHNNIIRIDDIKLNKLKEKKNLQVGFTIFYPNDSLLINDISVINNEN